MTADPDEQPARTLPPWSRWTAGGVAAAGLAAATAFREISNSDTGWHLALGRIIATRGLIFQNALTWTAPKYPWYPTAWLFDWLAFQATRAGGTAGAQAFLLGLVLLVLGGILVAVRAIDRQASPFALPALMLLLVPKTDVRPHVATWAVMAWALALVLIGRERGWRWRAAAVPLAALASNLHQGGAFVSAIIGVFAVEAAFRERRWAREALIATAALFALLANPGGLFNLNDLFAHLHVNSLVPITEHQPPTWATLPVYFVMLPLIAVAAWWGRRQPALVALVVLFALLTLKANRFFFELALLCVPLFVAAAAAWNETDRRRRGWLLLAATCAIGLAADASSLQHFPLGARFDQEGQPVRATEFLRREGIMGRGFNAYHDGGYLSWALPEVPEYMDGRPRAFPPEFFRDEFMAELSPQAFQTRLMSAGVEWAMTGSYGRVLTGERLLDSPDWALVYWDDVNEVFLRRGVPRWAEKIERLEYKYFRRSVDPNTLIFDRIRNASPEVLAAFTAELDRFEQTTHGDPVALLARCAVAAKMQSANADAVCARAGRTTP